MMTIPKDPVIGFVNGLCIDAIADSAPITVIGETHVLGRGSGGQTWEFSARYTPQWDGAEKSYEFNYDLDHTDERGHNPEVYVGDKLSDIGNRVRAGGIRFVTDQPEFDHLVVSCRDMGDASGKPDLNAHDQAVRRREIRKEIAGED